MSDVISSGDHAIKAQDHSAMALMGTDALEELRHYSRMSPRQDGNVPILAGLASDNDLLAQLSGPSTEQHTGVQREQHSGVHVEQHTGVYVEQHTGAGTEQHVGAHPSEHTHSIEDRAESKPMTEDEARQKVQDADKELVWAKAEAQRIANGGKPSNPFADLATILAGGNTYDARVNLGDVAVKGGDKAGAIAAYEDALSNFNDSPLNIITGGDGKQPPPQDLMDKLKDLGVSEDQALADIARRKADPSRGN